MSAGCVGSLCVLCELDARVNFKYVIVSFDISCGGFVSHALYHRLLCFPSVVTALPETKF